MPQRRYRTKPRKSASTSKNLRRTVKKVVRSYLKPEVKKITKTQTEQNLNTLSQNPYALSFTAIGQGTDDYQRVGNKVKAIGLNFAGFMCNNSSVPALVRILVLNQQNPETDMTSTSTNIFDVNTITSISSLTGVGVMYAPIDKNRYQVLYNKVIKCAATGASDGGNIVQFKKFIKLNKELAYDSSSTADCVKNNIRLMAFAAEAPNDVGAGTNVEFTAYGTLFYIDV